MHKFQGRLVARIIVVVSTGGAISGCGHLKPDIAESSVHGIPAISLNAFVTVSENTAINYKRRIAELERREWDTGTGNFIGGSVGAIGVVAQSIPIAGAGALTAGVGSLISTFYGVEKQNDAYSRAYAAVRCLSVLAVNINTPALEFVNAPTGGGDATTYSLRVLNSGAISISDRLMNQLRKRSVSAPPDYQQFQTYLKASLASAKAPVRSGVKTNTNPYGPVKFNNVVTFVSNNELDRVQSAVGRLDSDVGACLAAN
jgi:hypothetical protein